MRYTPVDNDAFRVSSNRNEARTGTGRCIEDFIYLREGHNGDNKVGSNLSFSAVMAKMKYKMTR